MEKFLTKLKNKKNLSFEESKAAFEILMDGKASDVEIFNFCPKIVNASTKVCTKKPAYLK